MCSTCVCTDDRLNEKLHILHTHTQCLHISSSHAFTHLLVHGSNDGSAQPHSYSETHVKVRIDSQGRKLGSDEEQNCIEISLPSRLSLIPGVRDHESERERERGFK